MIRYFRAILFLLPFLAFFPSTASAALSCAATVGNINFGQVSVRGGYNLRIVGNVRITCSGGTAGTVKLCLFVGSGSGGAASGNSPRYLRRTDGNTLNYTLNVGAADGPIWNNPSFSANLDSSGAGSLQTNMHATITSTGNDVKGGIYTSTFSGAGQVQLTYGMSSCLENSSTPSAFSVEANIVPTCSLTVGNLNFGEISVALSSPVYAQANINVSCSSSTPYTVTLGPGSGSGVTDPGARKMTNGPSTLAYGLYQNAGTSIPWGWTAGSNGYNGTGTGNTQLLTVYGRLNSGQTANVGTYTDSVVVTVTY